MFNQEDAYDFFMNKKSAVEAVENFHDQFLDIYEQLDNIDQKLLSECFQQMFRRYYYSTLVPDTPLTPANMINTLVERGFDKNAMVIPTFRLNCYKNKKIKNIDIGVRTFGRGEHFFVRDMEKLLKFAEKGIQLIEPGIIPPEKYSTLEDDITIPDRHYMNILCMSALEAGFLVRISSGSMMTAKTTPWAGEFLLLSDEEKLEKVISAVVKLCSKSITEAIPYLKNEFSEEGVMNLLKKPKDYDFILKPVFKKLGLNMGKIGEELLEDTFDEHDFLAKHKIDSMEDLFIISLMLDMYFYTPFGYYLQLIQPVYINEYDIENEADDILTNSEDIQSARMQLFTPAISYDLTPLGEAVLITGRKPKRKQRLPNEFGDNEMYQAVEINRSGIDMWDDDDYYDDDEDDDFEDIVDFSNVVNLDERRNKKKAMVIEQKEKKSETTKDEFDDN